MSRCLTDRSIDHVVLERGEVANSWRTERWDSLRLLTPNWMSRLPGHPYRGTDPDGYMTANEVIPYLGDYRLVLARRSRSTRRSHRGQHDDRLPHRHQPGLVAQPRRRDRDRVQAARPGSPRSAITCQPDPPARADPLPQPGRDRRGRRAGRRAPRPRAPRSPTSSAGAAGRSPSPSATTSACPARIGAWTSIGG